MSELTLGFLTLIISLKSFKFNARGNSDPFIGSPFSNSSFTTFNCADWQMSLISLALYDSDNLANSSIFSEESLFNFETYCLIKTFSGHHVRQSYIYPFLEPPQKSRLQTPWFVGSTNYINE